MIIFIWILAEYDFLQNERLQLLHICAITRNRTVVECQWFELIEETLHQSTHSGPNERHLVQATILLDEAQNPAHALVVVECVVERFAVKRQRTNFSTQNSKNHLQNINTDKIVLNPIVLWHKLDFVLNFNMSFDQCVQPHIDMGHGNQIQRLQISKQFQQTIIIEIHQIPCWFWVLHSLCWCRLIRLMRFGGLRSKCWTFCSAASIDTVPLVWRWSSCCVGCSSWACSSCTGLRSKCWTFCRQVANEYGGLDELSSILLNRSYRIRLSNRGLLTGNPLSSIVLNENRIHMELLSFRHFVHITLFKFFILTKKGPFITYYCQSRISTDARWCSRFFRIAIYSFAVVIVNSLENYK